MFNLNLAVNLTICLLQRNVESSTSFVSFGSLVHGPNVIPTSDRSDQSDFRLPSDVSKDRVQGA